MAGIVLGFRARARIIRAEGATKGGRLALAGIITGFAVLAFLVLVLVGALVPDTTAKSSDAALARRELIPASGYPNGFVDQGPGTAATQASYFSDWGAQLPPFLECLGATHSHIDTDPVAAAAHEYDHGDVWVNETIDVFPTTADADADAEAAANAKALSCQFEFWGPTIAKDLGPGLESSERDRPPIALGVRTLGRLGSIETWSMSYTDGGKTNTYYNDWVTLPRGRSESLLWISDLRSPVSSNLVKQLVGTAEGRMTSS